MRTVVSSSHPDPTRALPPSRVDEPPPLDDSALDPALADAHMPYSPQVIPQPGVPPAIQQLISSASGSPPPPQYITTGAPGGAPPPEGEWGDVPRLPPILQVEKQHVTTTATQAASASRRRNDAQFKCPVPGCGSTFTRRFNLRGHLRSHTEERPFVCEWPNCNKGFARQHDCKRHYALHNAKPNQHLCEGCGKTFSRTDALNRHLRSDGGSGCRKNVANNTSKAGPSSANHTSPLVSDPNHHPTDVHAPGALNGHYPISLAVQGPPDPNMHPHIHQHQLPPEISPQFLAGLLSGQQFLAAAVASDPNHQNAHAPYDPMIQGAPGPGAVPAPEPGPEPVRLGHITIVDDEDEDEDDEGSERPSKRRAISVGSEIVSVPVTNSGSGAEQPSASSRGQAQDDNDEAATPI